MIDPIVQEVRDARAAIAAKFDYDLGKYLAWIREQTELRKTALRIPEANKPVPRRVLDATAVSAKKN